MMAGLAIDPYEAMRDFVPSKARQPYWRPEPVRRLSLREQALAAIAEAPSIERCQQILFDVASTNAESRTRRLVRQAVERRAQALRIADIAGVRP